ncbi:ATP-dependent Clp protease ATP-binding subunit [Garciella nitratireducens]|uniref:ATP-dependent Clp protease ATP-binding subunit n=1 Tax=Garciella nitratireducens TaxID=218205 RepID=UPI000DE82856|nr:ATP-dependent Clp protease ATP-binding subunit [Garciella nitratireducens]RBP44008.1 ATP-dependent Clp protease ATP-binding subunit ClpA [Garciella nitratireducens]
MKKCSICKKNPAILFATTIENGKTEMKGLCIQCAKKLGMPIMDQLMEQTGMTEEDIENLTEEMGNIFEDISTEEDGDPSSLLNIFKNTFPVKKNDKKEVEKSSDVKEESYKKDSFSNKKISKRKKKNLETYGINLMDKAQRGEIDPIIGRNKEIDRVVQILNRRNKNNPILIGEPGVGKTAIAEGLAVRILEKKVPVKLYDKEIYLLDMTAIVAGTQFRGQFEGRMKAIIREATECGNIILVIDEVHNIMGAGEVHGGVMNAANILKPALARGEIQIMGATTLEEYRKHIEKDAALERRFQPVIVEESSIEESIEILEGIAGYYEKYHHVEYPKEVLEAAVKMSARYITDRYLPDKAIDVIDEAGSRVNLRNQGLIELEYFREELKKIQQLQEEAAQNNDYESVARYKMDAINLENKIEEIEKKSQIKITIDDIAHVIESWTHIPVQKITEEEAQKLLHLEKNLHQRIIGQDQAVKKLSRSIRRNRSGFRKKKKPSSFIFVGPTGVGKTELVRALAEELFGSEDAMIRFDMSEYMEKHTVSKLIGAPPGYVGYDEGGQLTEKVRRKPYSVILLDEIEKAHPDVFHLLLQILEDGRLTDAQGRTTFFENTIIIMTSNAGSQFQSASFGFGRDDYDEMESRMRDALKETFRPEFLNRVDDIIVFSRLSKEELRKIVDLMLKEVIEEVKEQDMSLEVSEELKDFILERGYDEKYGARPLRRTIQDYIEDKIAEAFLEKSVQPGDHIKITLKEGQIQLEKI